VAPVKRPDPVDLHVGWRIRAQRLKVGLSMRELGRRAGISFGNVQRYERGWNRTKPAHLLSFARTLGVSVDYFFAGAPDAHCDALPARAPVLSGPLLALCQDRGAVALLQAFNAIEDEGLRASIAALVGATAAAGEPMQ
jgi:transcriptional regulator with XRE-family HTH domain